MAMGKMGARGGFGSGGNLGGVSRFGMTQLASANQIFQRDAITGGAGLGTGVVPVTIKPVKTGNVYARTRKVSDGTIDQASYVAGTVASTVSQTFNVTAVNARLGWFYLDLSQDQVSWTLGTTPIGMGDLILTAGQSLMQRMFSSLIGSGGTDATTISGAGVTINDNSRIFCVEGGANVPTSWRQANDATSDLSGAGAPELGDKLVNASGVNVGIVGVNQGGTATAVWVSGQTLATALINTMAAAGGKFCAFWWFQGHSDSGNSVSGQTYQTNLTNIFGYVASNNSYPSFKKLITSIPYINSSGWGKNWQVEAIRRASYNWAQANGATVVMFNDQETVTDFVHELQIGGKRMARHAYRALRPYLGLSHDDSGATLGTPTKSTVNLVIPFTLPVGATALASGGGDASQSFKLYQGGDRNSPLALDATTPIAIDNVGHTITLKLASDPGSVPISILPFGAFETGTQSADQINLYDDLTDGDGIAYGRQLNWTPFPLRYGGVRDLTGGGTPAYSTGKFGGASGALSAGYGTLTAPPTPGLGTGMTLECWAQVVTPDAVNTQTIFGSVAGVSLRVLGNNLLIVGDTNTARTYTGALPTGSWVHLAFVFDPGQLAAAIYINGVKNGTTPAFFSITNFVANNPWGIGRNGTDTTIDHQPGGVLLIDEVALFDTVKYTANFTPPTSAYLGTETNLVALYHLDGGLTNSAT